MDDKKYLSTEALIEVINHHKIEMDLLKGANNKLIAEWTELIDQTRQPIVF